MNEDSRKLLAKLQADMELNRIRILSNPEPYLIKCNNEVTRCIQCLVDIEELLSPNIIFDLAQEMRVAPQDFRGADRVVNQRIRARIAEYMRGA